MIQMRSDGGSTPGGTSDSQFKDEEREQQGSRWLCVSCNAIVADDDDGISLVGRPDIEVHTNPAGISFALKAFGQAAVRVYGAAYPAFSWYPGYAWRIAVCFGCSAHLGWRYDKVTGADGPPTFYGLDVARLHRG